MVVDLLTPGAPVPSPGLPAHKHSHINDIHQMLMKSRHLPCLQVKPGMSDMQVGITERVRVCVCTCVRFTAFLWAHRDDAGLNGLLLLALPADRAERGGVGQRGQGCLHEDAYKK